MRGLNKLFGVAALMLATGLVTSCSSDSTVGEPDSSVATVKLGFAKAPVVRAWSGETGLGATRADGIEEGDVVGDVVVEEEDKTGWPEGFEPARENVYNDGHVKGVDEVEVNLAVNHMHDFIATGLDGEPTDETGSVNDLVTKLSIHVRYGHDVKVRIPVPAEYVVPVDDMAIVLSHKNLDETFKFETEVSTVSYNIDGNTVTLNVQYYADNTSEGVDFAEKDLPAYANGYICVWTEGITDEVMEAVFAKYGDGLNFEVWNYYNKPDELDEEGQVVAEYDQMEADDLFRYVNNSSVEFSIDQDGEREMPDAYINAFMEHESTPNGLNEGDRVDAFVYITGDGALNGTNQSQRLEFPGGYNTSYHLNGKAFNHIYNKYVEQVENDENEVPEAE